MQGARRSEVAAKPAERIKLIAFPDQRMPGAWPLGAARRRDRILNLPQAGVEDRSGLVAPLPRFSQLASTL